MIPHTPLLLVGAAHAMARHAAHMRRERPELPCSLEFVQALGATTHVDPVSGASSWPLSQITSIAMLERVARHRDLVRARARAGDLILFPAAEPVDAADGDAVGDSGGETAHETEEWQLGIILTVVDAHLETTGSIRRCVVATARAAARTEAMEVELLLRWCDTRWRDTLIRWYATPCDLECAA